MSAPSESFGSCLERAGFLFAHDCPRRASRHCARCFKAICAEHGHGAGEQVLCTGCAAPTPLSRYAAPGHGYYGRGAWGDELLPDPHDFTEADGGALREPAPTHPFEEDMQGS